MMQVVGKYLAIPYWRLLGDDALPDPVVTDALARAYASQEDEGVTKMVKNWLFIYGHDVPLNGELDEKTKTALASVDENFDPSDSKISSDTFVKVYLNMPISYEAGARQQELVSLLNAQEPEEEVASDTTEAIPATEPAPEVAEEPTTSEQNDSGEVANSAVAPDPSSANRN